MREALGNTHLGSHLEFGHKIIPILLGCVSLHAKVQRTVSALEKGNRRAHAETHCSIAASCIFCLPLAPFLTSMIRKSASRKRKMSRRMR